MLTILILLALLFLLLGIFTVKWFLVGIVVVLLIGALNRQHL